MPPTHDGERANTPRGSGKRLLETAGALYDFSSQVTELRSSSSQMGDTVRGPCVVKEPSGLDWVVKLPLHWSVSVVALGGCVLVSHQPPLPYIPYCQTWSQISQLT